MGQQQLNFSGNLELFLETQNSLRCSQQPAQYEA